MLNPIGFRPGPVTFWTTVVYLVLLIPVIVVNETVPLAPEKSPWDGVNLTEAWLDLARITADHHPYNSDANERTRNYLLLRIQEILDKSGISWSMERLGPDQSPNILKRNSRVAKAASSSVVVFDDMASNSTFLGPPSKLGTNVERESTGEQATYFEGTNIYVYIRGSEDDVGDWWKADAVDQAVVGKKGGVLVNAHYDSVSTSYGATDDGMAVVTVLQLLKYFTRPGHQPKRGVVLLLNNGEEDGLFGIQAFGKSPIWRFCHVFLNLEGAGAGGRPLLFRSSDREVTSAYSKTKNPLGFVITSDLFELGFIKSMTDYKILFEEYGMRGLDLAFYKPRSKYHTAEDDAKHASKDSLWQMMDISVHTTVGLSGDLASAFDGKRSDADVRKVSSGSPSYGVWFDVLGKGFVLFGLRGLFAWTLTVLNAGPLILLLVTYVLRKVDKYYLFTGKVRSYERTDYDVVPAGGWKGFTRFPVALVFAAILTFGAAFLLNKINPFVVYGNPYTVWAMLLSLFYVTVWCYMRGADSARPSALHRGYALIWLFILGWAILIPCAVLEDRYQKASVYVFVLFESAVFLATLLALLELFALPKKSVWGQQVREDHEAREHLQAVPNSDDLIAPTPGEALSPRAGPQEDLSDNELEPVTETTPLVGRSEDASRGHLGTTFATTYRRSLSAFVDGARQVRDTDGSKKPFGHEQAWSTHLPSFLWWLQFMLMAPLMIFLVAPAGLTIVDAVRQTGADGTSTLLPYLMMAGVVLLLSLPLTPFIHRVSHRVPVFLLVVFFGTLVFNLVIFPFSTDSKYKALIQQTIDTDTGESLVHAHGIKPYVLRMLEAIPSASGKEITCKNSTRAGLQDCSFPGTPPNLDSGIPNGVPLPGAFADLIAVNVTRGNGNTATLGISATDSRACTIKFSKPVTHFEVVGGSGLDDNPKQGVGLIKLWHRDPTDLWVVNVQWATNGGNERGLSGKVLCQWSDLNAPERIPAIDEALKYCPTWAIWTKVAEGLVEGSKSFVV